MPNYARSWRVLSPTAERSSKPTRAFADTDFPYWDALIWATAKHHGIPDVLSEDFSDGSRIEGVRFQNPFAPAFDLATLGG